MSEPGSGGGARRASRNLKTALAGATALFVSMAPTADTSARTLKLGARRKARCEVRPASLRAGPLSVRTARIADASFWRPRVGMQCGAKVHLQVLDLGTGKVIDETVAFTGDGEALQLVTQLPSTKPDDNASARVLGARVLVSPEAGDELPACQKTFPFRLTLQTSGLDGTASQFFEAWPCKWHVPELALD